MNIVDALYFADDVRAEIARRTVGGQTEDQAISDLADEVIATTEDEVLRGVVHGFVEEMQRPEPGG